MTHEGAKKCRVSAECFSFLESCTGDITSSLTREPSALTLLANDNQRTCALPVAKAAVRRSVHASLYRCIRCKWAARPAGRHGKPIIHLNTKPERCMWLKLMLFLPLLKLSRRDHLLPLLPSSQTPFRSYLVSRIITPLIGRCEYFFELLLPNEISITDTVHFL